MIFFISVLINANGLARLKLFLLGIYLGGIAQLVEHLPCKQDVIGSNPITSTRGRTLPGAYPKIVSALVAIVQGATSIIKVR